jgi:hypothetical protein
VLVFVDEAVKCFALGGKGVVRPDVVTPLQSNEVPAAIYDGNRRFLADRAT